MQKYQGDIIDMRLYNTIITLLKNKHLFGLLFLLPIKSVCMESGEETPLLNNWKEHQHKYVNRIMSKNRGTLDIEIDDLDKNPQVRAYGIRKWWNSPTTTRFDNLAIATCSCTPWIACNALIAVVVFSVDSSDDGKAHYLIGSLACLGSCALPLGYTMICAFVKAQKTARKETAYLQTMHHMHTQFFSDIQEQNIEKIIPFLANNQSFDLNDIINTEGDTPLLAAIKYANSEKDPHALIVKALISKKATLWYSGRYPKKSSVSPRILEAGLEIFPLCKQPLILLLNNSHLRETVLKPLCNAAEERLVSRRAKKLSHDAKIVLMLLEDKPENGKDEV
jgi:hypothetical protein